MLSSLNDIKQGVTIVYNGELWQVMEAKFLRMQQRKPVMQTKLKNIVTGKALEVSFKSGDKVEDADVARKPAQFLYADNDGAYFMDQESFEQFSVPRRTVEGKLPYLKEGESVATLFWKENPVTIEIPKKVELRVTAAPPGTKGDTAQGRVTKLITLENGLTVNAPLFIKEGDSIRINTDTGEYVERVS